MNFFRDGGIPLMVAVFALSSCLGAEGLSLPPRLPRGMEMIKEWKLAKDAKFNPQIQPVKSMMRKGSELIEVSIVYLSGETVISFWQKPFVFSRDARGISLADTRQEGNADAEDVFRPFEELRWLMAATPGADEGSGTVTFEHAGKKCVMDLKTGLPVSYQDAIQTITYRYNPISPDSVTLPAEFAAKLAEYQEIQTRPSGRLLKLGR